MTGPFTGRLRALRHRDFRVFWLGQGASVTGTWMQTVAQSWLVYRLTDSPLLLGVLAFARFGPSLLGSPLAGVLTDRFPRRSLVLTTQAMSLLQASTLAALTFAGVVRVWHVLALALFQGIVDTLDMPARQTLQVDLVGVEDVSSAIALNSSMFNVARIVGPALAGPLVAAVGEATCFAVNAASYLAVLLALALLRLPRAGPRTARRLASELREGFAYAWGARQTRSVLAAVAVTAAFGLSYSTLLPVFARDVLGSGVKGYGMLLAWAGVGAIAGALGTAGAHRPISRVVPVAQAVLGVGLIALAAVRSQALAALCMIALGTALAVQLTASNGYLQMTAPAHLRGRVVSLYIWLFAGLSPVGGLLAGVVAEHFGAPVTAAGAGAACLLAAAVVAGTAGRGHRPGGDDVVESAGEGA